MSRLKKYDDYIKEQDQHRMESEKDVVIQNEIDDIHSDETEGNSDIQSEDISPNELDSLRNANDVHENVVNEGAVKNLLLEITEVLEDLIRQREDGQYQGEIDEYAQRIFALMTRSESLTEQEDIPQIIIDQEEARRFKETKDTLDGKSKEVYDTTTDVEKSLEKEDNEETQHPYEEQEDTVASVEVNDFVIEESDDFIIHPNGEDFRLIKEALGEETNYQSLRVFLKTSFPGWENHTSEILDAWKLIK